MCQPTMAATMTATMIIFHTWGRCASCRIIARQLLLPNHSSSNRHPVRQRVACPCLFTRYRVENTWQEDSVAGWLAPDGGVRSYLTFRAEHGRGRSRLHELLVLQRGALRVSVARGTLAALAESGHD